jgi:hypothetical protein
MVRLGFRAGGGSPACGRDGGRGRSPFSWSRSRSSTRGVCGYWSEADLQCAARIAPFAAGELNRRDCSDAALVRCMPRYRFLSWKSSGPRWRRRTTPFRALHSSGQVGAARPHPWRAVARGWRSARSRRRQLDRELGDVPVSKAVVRVDADRWLLMGESNRAPRNERRDPLAGRAGAFSAGLLVAPEGVESYLGDAGRTRDVRSRRC